MSGLGDPGQDADTPASGVPRRTFGQPGRLTSPEEVSDLEAGLPESSSSSADTLDVGASTENDPEPAASEPSVSSPGPPETVVAPAETSQPAARRPAVADPGAPESSVLAAVTTPPVVPQPVAPEAVVAEPAVPEPVSLDPAVMQPIVPEPAVSGSAVTQPVTPQPDVPSAAGPEPAASRVLGVPRRGPDGGPRIIAVANQKGGVGKTTTTVNLGAAAAELGHRVLIVDLDPQGNASTGLGINPRSLEASMYDVLLHDVPIDEAIEAVEVRNLFVAPANLDLAGAEIELVPAFSRELRLKNAIATVASDFDLVLIDCPPSLGLLTVNAFAAASEVLVPIQCEYYALEGLGQLMRNVDLVKRNLNASLDLSAIVLVMYDARTNLAAQVAEEVREHFGSKVCRAVIPRNIRLSEAPSFGQPITVFDPSSRGAIAYRDLAKEFAGEPS
ncbi:MAG: chromosome partitioning protein [Acidimicrobiales bacterium]